MTQQGYETEFGLDRVAGPVSSGIHTFNITAVDEKPGPNGQYLALTLECLDQGDDLGKNVFDNISLTPRARFKLEEFLDAVGAPAQGRARASMFINRHVRAQIAEETYKTEDEAGQEVTRTKAGVQMYISAGPVSPATPAPTTTLPIPAPNPIPAPTVETPQELGGGTGQKPSSDWDVPF